jgi:RHS repeat-associated protein
VKVGTTYGGAPFKLTTLALDHLGSTRAEVYGASSWTSMEYKPFGEMNKDTHYSEGALDNGAHLFTAHEREFLGDVDDPLEGLDYMHARYYSAGLGRFFSVDAAEGDAGASQTWNGYTYVNDNPLVLFDPDGLQERNRIVVKKLRRPLFARVAPSIRSSSWTPEMVNAQLSEAQKVFADQACVFLSWGAPTVQGPPADEISLHDASEMSDSMAISANRSASGETPLAFVGEFSGAQGGTATRAGEYGPLGAGIVGNPGGADPLTAAHELGHGLGGLHDATIQHFGDPPMSPQTPNLMNDNNLAPILTPAQIDTIREYVSVQERLK